ncbi:MAG: hypothetical protein JO246_01935 [Frankiaceae bacterium]|nr:hypothetical protein [Frankiaceae bacterium]MBV9871835.1 hypothetical protein [Frankiaceae bacterium]
MRAEALFRRHHELVSGSQTGSHPPPDFDLSALAPIFRRIEELIRVSEVRPNDPAPGSAFAGDVRWSPDYNGAYLAQLSFSVATDHLHALHTALVTGKTIHTYAPFTLLRGTLDNAATGIWLLMPSKRSERVLRALRVGGQSIVEVRAIHDITGQLPTSGRTPDQQLQALKSLAASRGLDPDLVGGRLGTASIIRAASNDAALSGSDLELLLWRVCSGLNHGRSWATLAALERDVVEKTGNALMIRLTAPSVPLLATAEVATHMTERLYELLELRRTDHLRHLGVPGR